MVGAACQGQVVITGKMKALHDGVDVCIQYQTVVRPGDQTTI